MARVYILRGVALFSGEENLVPHAEYFRNENFVSRLVYLRDIFEKFSTLNTTCNGTILTLL